jgi:hypothetical protein
VRALLGPVDPTVGLPFADPTVDPDAQAALEAVLSAPRPSNDFARPARRGAVRHPVQLRQLVVPVALTTIAIVGGVALISGRTYDAHAATPPPLTFDRKGEPGTSRLLHRLASAAERDSHPGDHNLGRYMKTATWSLQLRTDHASVTGTIVPEIREVSVHPDGSVEISSGTGPAIPTNERGWANKAAAAAAPKRVGEERRLSARESGSAAIGRLSTRPELLTRQLLKGTTERAEDNATLFLAVTDVLGEVPVDGQLRSALYRVLANTPGVADLGRVTDRAGRDAVAVGLESDRSGARTRYALLLSPSDGQFLGTERILMAQTKNLVLPVPSVIGYSVILGLDTSL